MLERAAQAPTKVAYSGTQYVSAWGPGEQSAQVVSVSHDPQTGTTWRPVGAASGPPLHAFTSLDPSMLGAGVVSLIARHYSLDTADPGGKVAGREVDLVQASRSGGSAPARVAARFWLDRDTGLILRREVYDERGRPSRASAFVDIAVRRADFVASARTSSFPEANEESLDMAGVARMRAHGWTCPKRLPGPLTLVDARRKPNSGVLQLSYADGLSSVSVFQQPGRLDEEEMVGYRRDTLAGRDVWVREEVPVRVLWSADGRVFTLLADAPQRTVVRAVAALSARHSGADTGPDTGAGSAWERLGRGLDRVASWFNPR